MREGKRKSGEQFKELANVQCVQLSSNYTLGFPGLLTELLAAGNSNQYSILTHLILIFSL